MSKQKAKTNRWDLGGELVDRTKPETVGGQTKCVVTLERSDGAQFRRHLIGQVAAVAQDVEFGEFLALTGTVYKGTFKPEDSEGEIEVLRYSVRELDVVDEAQAAVNSLKITGEVSETSELTETESGRPKCPIKVLVGKSVFTFNAYDEVAKAAAKLVAGDTVSLVMRFFFVEAPNGGYRTRFTVLELTRESAEEEVAPEASEEQEISGPDSESAENNGGVLARLGMRRS